MLLFATNHFLLVDFCECERDIRAYILDMYTSIHICKQIEI